METIQEKIIHELREKKKKWDYKYDGIYIDECIKILEEKNLEFIIMSFFINAIIDRIDLDLIFSEIQDNIEGS